MGKGASDGLAGEEGTFSMCTFWLVECLTRAGRLNEARLIFEKMLSYANHVGLYAEEVGPSGCSHEQFCNSVDASVKGGKKLCKKSDWKNDEPLMTGRDRDCAVDKGGSGRGDDRCVPAP